MKSLIKVNKYDIYPSKNIAEYDDTKSPFSNLFTHNLKYDVLTFTRLDIFY